MTVERGSKVSADNIFESTLESTFLDGNQVFLS